MHALLYRDNVYPYAVWDNLRLTQSDSLRPITSALVSSYVVLNESADVGVNYECI